MKPRLLKRLRSRQVRGLDRLIVKLINREGILSPSKVFTLLKHLATSVYSTLVP